MADVATLAPAVIKRKLLNDLDKPPVARKRNRKVAEPMQGGNPNEVMQVPKRPPDAPEYERPVSEPHGWTALEYEMGLHHRPLQHGVVVDDYLKNLKKNKARRDNLLRSTMTFGSADGRNAGFMRKDSRYIRARGRDDITRGATEDGGRGMPSSYDVRNVHGGFASKHGFHEGYNPRVGITSQVEQHAGGVDKVPAVEQESLTRYSQSEMLYSGAMAHGMDGGQVYGAKRVDKDAIKEFVAASDRVSADEFGAGRGGRFQAGAKGSRWIRSAVSSMDDGGAFSKMPQDQGAYKEETVYDMGYEKDAANPHRQPATREGFRQRKPAGATDAFMKEVDAWGAGQF
tara:strand:+ start:445 stop:1473 length:1029 start_codon:yes stop_codon:yes gene_type:complete